MLMNGSWNRYLPPDPLDIFRKLVEMDLLLTLISFLQERRIFSANFITEK